MAATEALLTSWIGLPPHIWNGKEEESMATMKARLRAMTMAMQAKDAAFADLQGRLNAALVVVEQAQAREAALLQRAQKSEEAEEALASQMAELEAEAFTRITQAYRLLASHDMVPEHTTSQLSMQVAALERRLEAALDKEAAMSQRCEVLEEELARGRVREAALQRRAEIAEEAEEALASQMAEVEAEAFTRITESSKLLAQERSNALHDESCQAEAESNARSQVAGLERQLAEAGEKLEAVNAKLRQAEEKNGPLEMRLVQEGEKVVTLKRKQSNVSEERVMSLDLEDLAGFVKLKLWNPSSFRLPTVKTASS